MSQPVLVSQSPTPNETSVVLGHLVELTFDQPINQSTLNEATFSLSFQGDSQVFDADNLSLGGRPASQKQHVAGTFSFPEPAKAVFTSSTPLRPKTEYTVIVAGGSSLLAQSVVKNLAGEKLKQSYTWKFVTTEIASLTGSVTPISSPLTEDDPELTSDMIQIFPRKRIGADFTESIEIHFPADIDLESLDASYGGASAPLDANPFNDILVSMEAPNNDPLIAIPENVTYSVTIDKNVIRIDFQGVD
jgi:hypothetical protein